MCMSCMDKYYDKLEERYTNNILKLQLHFGSHPVASRSKKNISIRFLYNLICHYIHQQNGFLPAVQSVS